jgi:WD repeat-containing protein 24
MPFRTTDPDDELNIEASQTIIPDDPINLAADDPSELNEKKTKATPASRQPSYGAGQTDAVTAQQMTLEMLEYYTDRTPNAQLVYHLTNLLRTVSQESEMGNDSSFPLEPEPINPLREQSILSTYQEQLQGLQIYNASVSLALEAVKGHQYLFDTANAQIGFICMGCMKPINNPLTKFRCENCGQRQAPCPICWQKYPAIEATKKSRKAALRSSYWTHQSRFSNSENTTEKFPQAKESSTLGSPALVTDSSPVEAASQTKHPILWQSCLVCGHGAHASCLQHVQNDPRIGGKCPTEGCLCDCIPGPYRTQLNREALDERARKERGSVRRDSVRAPESKAVSRARGLLEGDGRRVRLVEPAKMG